jgi:hypothetical protein
VFVFDWGGDIYKILKMKKKESRRQRKEAKKKQSVVYWGKERKQWRINNENGLMYKK